MGRDIHIVFLLYLLSGSIDLCLGYGTKGGHHSFSQSYSSSSASAHSSSYSTSGSYTFGDKSVLPIVGPIPIAAVASASASASAGGASAVAGASAGSTAGGVSTVLSKTGDYGISGNNAHSSIPSHNQIHGSVGSYGASGNNVHVSTSGEAYNSQSAVAVSGSVGKNNNDDDKSILKPPCCKKIAPGPDGSIYDYKVPSSVNTIAVNPVVPGNAPHSSGTYGVSNVGAQTSSTGYGTQSNAVLNNGNVKTDKKTCCKGPFPGPNGSIYDSKPASAVGTAVKPTNSQKTITKFPPLYRPQVNFPGASGSIYTSKPVNTGGSTEMYTPNQNKPTGGYKPLEPPKYPQVPTGTYQTNTVVKPAISGSSGSYAPEQNKPTGSYQPIQPQKTPQAPSGGYQTNTFVKPAISGSSGSYTPDQNKPTGSYQPLQPQQIPQLPSGGYQTNPVAKPAITGSSGSYAPEQNKPTGSYEPLQPQQIPQVPSGGYQTNTFVKPAISGSSGSYTPEQHKPTGSYQPLQPQQIPQVPSGGYQTITVVKPAITGSSGSYAPEQNKPTGSYQPLQPQQIPQVPSGGYQTSGSSSVGTGGQYGFNSNANVASTSSISHQGTVDYKLSCNKGICTQQPPRTYLQPPQVTEKPVTETVQEQISPVLPDSGNNISPQTSTTIIKKPEIHQSNVNQIGVVPASNYGKPQEPSRPQQTISIGNTQKKEYGGNAGGYSSSSSIAGSSSIGYSTSGGSYGQKKIETSSVPSISILPNTPDRGDQDQIIYVSHTGSQGQTSDSSVKNYPSVTENSVTGVGLREGPRGSPWAPGAKSDYDESKGDSAIIFTDGGSGSYSTGRGYASASAYSGAVGGSNVIYSGTKQIGSKPGGTYVSSVLVDLDKLSGGGKLIGSTGKNGGVIVVGTSTDNSKVGGFSSGSSGTVGSDGSGQGILVVQTSLDSSKPAGGSGSYGYVGHEGVGSGNVIIETNSNGGVGSGSYGHVGHKGIPCHNNRCGTAFRQYSNGYPSKNVAIHVSSVPSGSGGSFVSGGSYGGGKFSGGYGGSAAKGGGSYASSASFGDGGGGFLSSLFVGDGAAGNVGSHGKSGGYAHSGSFSKASSYASSSSFASASSGSYSSSHY